ncbi:MAG: hypothetical protein JRN06_01855 [Nitrososphaerota archaeon]|nr:hypothetical protein [Nitrososphaerota archaeon]MDG7023400.1 hypothetical protein [Nitrososphaerota archaeon]
MNLPEVEVVAGQLVEQKKRLGNLDAELARVQRELKEQPRRSEKDKGFYSLIGLDYQEPFHVKQSEEQLLKERAEAAAAVKQAHETLVRGFSSSELVVPLDPAPVAEGKHFTFYYRFNASYPKTVEALSDILGLPSPLKIGEVVISPDRIEVNEVDEYFAKQKIVEAFGSVRKTVALKLGPRG